MAPLMKIFDQLVQFRTHISETGDVPDAVDGAEPARLPRARGAERDARRRAAARDLQGDHGHRRPEPG